MSSITHGMKKRMSRATTRTKTIDGNMPAEYTAAKQTMVRQKAAVAKAVEMVESAKKNWTQVFETEKDFAEHILTETAVDGSLYATATESVEGVRNLQKEIAISEAPDSHSVRMIGVAKGFLAEIESIEKEIPDVNTSYTEKARYEKKMGKLQKNDGKTEKKSKNLDKLENVRAVFDSKMDGIVERIKKANARYEEVLRCVHGAFWMGEGRYMGMVDRNTSSVRGVVDVQKDDIVKPDSAAKVKKSDE